MKSLELKDLRSTSWNDREHVPFGHCVTGRANQVELSLIEDPSNLELNDSSLSSPKARSEKAGFNI
ncbi:hypothetical protein WG66_011956 [Moniliophthora roreri]|nr:hypothetical protein WG66_011956 [Moniliophthora roreri]